MIKIITGLILISFIFISDLSELNAKQQMKQERQLSGSLQSISSQSSPSQSSVKEPIEVVHETSLKAQIYQLADKREYNQTVFSQALKSKDIDLQQAALICLGRIGGSEVIAAVKPFLQSKDQSLRQLAVLAIGISGEKSASQLLWQRLNHEKIESVKQEIYLGLANLADPADPAAPAEQENPAQKNLINKMLSQARQEKSEAVLSSLFQGLSIVLTFNSTIKQDYNPQDLDYVLQLVKQNSQASATAALFLSRIAKVENYFQLADVIDLTQLELSAQTKSYSMRLVGRLTLQSNSISDQQKKILDWAIANSSSKDFNVQVESVRLLAKMIETNSQALNKLIRLTQSNNFLLAQTALQILAQSTITSDKLITVFKTKLSHINSAIQVEAMTGLIKRQTVKQATWILPIFTHKKAYVKIQLIKLLANQYLSENAVKQNATQADDAKKIIALFKQDNDKLVSQYAQNTLTPIAKPDESPAHSPSYIAALSASKKRVLLKTEIGNITIQLNHNAPFTSWHFINNINNGYFNQSYFNRVIANFVAQGGDNIGDGEGSSGKTIREEINLLSHKPMSVGMATLGKDTGSSQFFINTARNFHLDRNYTVFGHVIEGQEVAYQFTHGVKILDVKILPQPL